MPRRPRKPHHALPFTPSYAGSDGSEKTLPIQGYRQARSYSCGFATALMVARYFVPDVEARRLYRELGTGRDGTRQNAIVKVLRRVGVGANVRYDVGFERLRREIGLGKLVIGYLHDTEHWVLLYGYGLEPARVFIADPEPGKSCARAWEGHAERLREFGIVCSTRPRRTASAAIPLPAPREPVGTPTAPMQLSFAFMREGG